MATDEFRGAGSSELSERSDTGSSDREETSVRRVIVNEWMTLDGVVQGPGHAYEDTDGGFEHGGWHMRYFDDISRTWVVEGYAEAGGFLLGRRTYQILAGYWPTAPKEEQAVAQPLNTLPKYVASKTLTEPLEWQNSTVLHGDVAEAVLALKQEEGGDLHVIGSPEFVQTLIEHDLVDEFRVMIDPVVVGGGKRLFRDGGALRPLRLVESQVTTTGAITATYVAAES
jgi:dihydrofolate reductase